MNTPDPTSYASILSSRGIKTLEKNTPLWKLKITDAEYDGLKQTLKEHEYNLSLYGMEAALCYAEWWRRDYNGNIPSKEDVAIAIGLHYYYGDELFMAARNALKKRGYTFIHSLKGTEYFRTLLNQGGLPINYIKKSDSNIGTFSRFLKGLVRELSIINYDWSTEDNSIIRQFNCISYLGKAFKNENIYDVSMQIAHAIIMDDNTLLPYDDTDESLAELTHSLKREYSRVQRERRTRPLSLSWKLRTTENGNGYLFINMDVIKDISSNSIPGLNISTCSTFDVFVAGTIVGKYVRKSINRNEFGEEIDATYTRISVGMSKDILWKGEPVVEVKIRCDNDERIFLTISGCYPPNFEYPQVFQKLDDNLYSKSETANSEDNIAIFNPKWKGENTRKLSIGDNDLCYSEFSNSLYLENEETGEEMTLTNQFTPYTAEFSGNYISWVEKSNYKLLAEVPVIRVYDKEKDRVNNNIRIRYRVRRNGAESWHNLNSSCSLPTGLIDICVEFPDGHKNIETFYAIGNLSFSSRNATALSTEMICTCDSCIRLEMEQNDDLDIEKCSDNSWRISRKKDSNICPSVCDYRIYNPGTPTLCLSVAIPFDGIMLTDVRGCIIPNGKIISLANLANFCIISHGRKKNSVDITYTSERIEDVHSIKHLKRNVIDGIVSLSDYSDLIIRMFNLYGANSFDRSSSVVLNISGTKVCIRKFVLETTFKDGKIIVSDDTEPYIDDIVYEHGLYAFPADEVVDAADMSPIKLIRENEYDNVFIFPEDYSYKEVIVFSGPEARRRVIPKYYHLSEEDLDHTSRTVHSRESIQTWLEILHKSDVMFGTHWRKACKAYEICSRNNLPFTTYNGLKAIARMPKLLAKFVLAMWLNDYKDVLAHDIDRFEQEMAIALHWVPQRIWTECINELFNMIPNQFQSIIYSKIQNLVELLKDIFNSTISNEISNEFATYLISGDISKGQRITSSEVNNYKMKTYGLSDTNEDLPTIKYELKGVYYPYQERMLRYYRTMIESAMCAAENTGQVADCTNLFSIEAKEHAKLVNFYRQYFKETYSEIFLKTLKQIINPAE